MNFKSLLQFLSDLKDNNNRDWFNENKSDFIILKKQFEDFIDALIPKVSEIDPRIEGNEAKDCIFRIYKDTRFSKDKTPYKTNFGAYISNGGRKSKYAGYYLHVEPKGSFLGGGIHMPTSDVLKLLRTEIQLNGDEFLKIIQNKTFQNYFGDIYGEKLKSAPRGFLKDDPMLDYLRLKSYTVVKYLSDDEIISEDYVDILRKGFSLQKPFNDYLNNALE